MSIVKPQIRGITVTELLVSLGLLSLIFLFTLPLVKSASRIQSAFRKREAAYGTTTLVFQTIARAVESSRALSALPLVRIHSNGMITYADHSRYALPSSAAVLQPSSQSDAISILMPKPEIFLSVIERTVFSASADSIDVVACFDAGGQSALKTMPPIAQASSWLAFGVDGFFEVSAHVRRLQARVASCSSGIAFQAELQLKTPAMFSDPLRKTESGLAFSPRHILNNVVALVPIAESYSLYVDRVGTFRRVSHVSNENQPIVKTIARLTLVEEDIHEKNKQPFKKLQVSIFLRDLTTLELKEYPFSVFWGAQNSQEAADIFL